MNNIWDHLPEPVRAGLVAFLVALLRVLYDDKEPRWVRRFLEAVLCGLIAVGVSHLIEAMGLPSGWATFAGAMIGLQGADWVRSLGRKMAERRLK